MEDDGWEDNDLPNVYEPEVWVTFVYPNGWKYVTPFFCLQNDRPGRRSKKKPKTLHNRAREWAEFFRKHAQLGRDWTFQLDR